MSTYLWTSEAVSCGHPDKVSDQIADAILDAYLLLDPNSRVAVEVVVTTDPKTGPLVILTGEITSVAAPQLNAVVEKTLTEIGYSDSKIGFWPVTIENHIRQQSSEISGAVTKESGEIGAGDQGIMFGYACIESPELMPLAHYLSHRLIQILEKDRRNSQQDAFGNSRSPLLPDAKTQVTVEYENHSPERVDTVLISTQHSPNWSLQQLEDYIRSNIIQIFDKELAYANGGAGAYVGKDLNKGTKYLINPAGAWTIGGPVADTGLSGRKIVVDNYGADCPIGGGSFSGKDPTKVDRSGAYAARHIAKNLVAAGLAEKVQVQLSYAIGVVEPISIRVQTFGTRNASILSEDADELLTTLVRNAVPLSPRAIIERLQLKRPIYQQTASGGHFGRFTLPWEALDLVHVFKAAFAARPVPKK